MSLWVKVFTNFYSHRKTMRLRSVIGDDAFWVPPRLWAYAAENQPDGDFSGYTAPEIAGLIGYSKDASSMLEALVKSGFLDADLKIHNWMEHNAYHKVYAERARAAAIAKHQKQKERNQEREIDEKRGEETSILEARFGHASSSKGNGKPPGKFVSELSAQIREANEEIQRLKDSGDPSNKPRIRELCQKRREWREEMLSQ